MKIHVKPKLTCVFLTVVIVGFIVAINVGPLITRPAPVGFSDTLATHAGPLTASATPIGISYGDTLVWDSSRVLSQTLDDAVAVGITTIRLDLAWDDIQPNSVSNYKWVNFDKVVQAARSRNLTLLPILDYTPAWARPLGCTTDKCAPANPKAFASFAAAASRRYAPLGVHTHRLWRPRSHRHL